MRLYCQQFGGGLKIKRSSARALSAIAVTSQPGGGLQIRLRRRILPEQLQDVAAKNIEMWFVWRQPNCRREILERGLRAVRFNEMYLAAVLPRLPEIRVQPKGFIQERKPAARRACRRQLESRTEYRR